MSDERPTLAHYDEFRGPALDMSRWQFLAYPLPDGSTWVCREPRAARVADGTVELRVERFENAHATHQNIDNCKHLLLVTTPLTVPPDGRTTFEVREPGFLTHK